VYIVDAIFKTNNYIDSFDVTTNALLFMD